MAGKYFQLECIQNGKRVSKTIKASSKMEAIVIAKESMGLKIIKAKEVGTPIFNMLSIGGVKNSVFKKKVSLDALISAIRQIAVMANAGLSFTDILKEAIAATENERLREILAQNLHDINAGLSFSASLSHFEKDVGRLTITMVELGEKTGTLAESLDSLAGILEEIRSNRAKIKKALAYPVMVVMAMIIAFTTVIILVVPKFKAVFDKFKADLPLPTKMLLGAEHFLNSYGIMLLIFITLSVFAIKYIHATNEKIRIKLDKTALKLPIIGSMLQIGLVSRFTIVFKELNKAGLPIVEALNVSSKGVENSYLRGQFMTITVSVQRGMSLTESLKEAKVYENMIIQMISAGEQGGSLGIMLDKVADYYRHKFQNKMDNLSSAIEPILIGGIAIFVLILALGIFMPMWDLAKAARGGH